jgi:hypothetical protein
MLTTKAGAHRRATQLGHRLGSWHRAAFLGDAGVKAQCRDCGRHVVVVAATVHGDAVEVECSGPTTTRRHLHVV